MSGAAKPIEDVVVNSADGEREQAVRNLLIKYQRALALIERLAIALLDSVQPDAEPMAPEQARERRHTVAEAMTMVATETPHGEQLWRELVLERRLSHPEAPLPLAVRVDRRRKSPRRAASRPKL